MYRVIIVLCLCIPGLCSAQDHKVDFGLSAPLYFRPAHPHNTYSEHYNLFGVIGLDGVLRVKGDEEGNMSFVLKAGITADIRKFNINYISKVKTNLYFFNINPSIVIPSRWEHIQFCLGIGALIQFRQTIAMAGVTDGGGYSNAGTMDSLLKANGRGIMPYMSFGISGDIGKHLRLELIVQPTLRNLYEPNTNITFVYNTGYTIGSTNLELNYQPVYVGLRLFYFFKGNE